MTFSRDAGPGGLGALGKPWSSADQSAVRDLARQNNADPGSAA